jgi:hypothetical protein
LSYTGCSDHFEAGAAMLTTLDPELERHQHTWLGFVRFMKIMIVLIVMILGGMAIFLL